jgi:phosphoglycerate dehydrogenase-like enzyme
MRILFDPDPRTRDEVFSPAAWAGFSAAHAVTEYDGSDRAAFYARHLPQTEILASQQPMPRAALDAAPHLKAIFNVETNFLPNIDYDECFRRGIHVLAPSAVFAAPVAEMALGMALSLARNIHGAHRDFTQGNEKWLFDGNREAELLHGTTIGFVGFGDLGRAIHRLLAGFDPRVSVYDPWLPDGHLARMGVAPASLDAVLSGNRLVFVVAGVTTENRHFLNAERLALMQPGAMLVLVSRAAVADFPALCAAAASGRIRVATDVFPVEPVAKDDPVRAVPNMLFSAHRAGALTGALQEIGTRMAEDIALIAQGLPPVACRRAERETVARMRSMPVSKS